MGTLLGRQNELISVYEHGVEYVSSSKEREGKSFYLSCKCRYVCSHHHIFPISTTDDAIIRNINRDQGALANCTEHVLWSSTAFRVSRNCSVDRLPSFGIGALLPHTSDGR
jgi:hypothetical protein